jgi:hypothetical protein
VLEGSDCSSHGANVATHENKSRTYSSKCDLWPETVDSRTALPQKAARDQADFIAGKC